LNFTQILLQLSRTDLPADSGVALAHPFVNEVSTVSLSANNWLSKLQKTFSTRNEGLNKSRGWFSKPNCA